MMAKLVDRSTKVGLLSETRSGVAINLESCMRKSTVSYILYDPRFPIASSITHVADARPCVNRQRGKVDSGIA